MIHGAARADGFVVTLEERRVVTAVAILDDGIGGGFNWTSLGIQNNGGVVFLCPQTLPKFHPAFDKVLHRVLHLNEKAHVLIIYDKEKPL